jgi:uncharacterized protein (DUF2384 family)
LETARDADALRDVHPLLQRLVASYSASVVASLLDVDRAQVSRWMSGRDPISDTMSARIAAVHAVILRAHQVLTAPNVASWLFGSEPLLGGARPLDALALRGAGPVLEALDGIEDGVYA